MSGLNVDQLRRFVVEPTLRHLDPEIPYSLAAERLVIGTAIHESAGLVYLDQLSRDPARPGPAYGLWQMEARTLADHYAWFADRVEIREKIALLMSGFPPLPAQLHGNLYLSCAMCRVHYRRVADVLPDADDSRGLGAYWKRWYNTAAGAGTVTQGEAAMRVAIAV